MISLQIQVKDTKDPDGSLCSEVDVTFSDPNGETGHSLGGLIGYAIIAAEPCLLSAQETLEGVRDVLTEHVAGIKHSSYEEFMKGLES